MIIQRFFLLMVLLISISCRQTQEVSFPLAGETWELVLYSSDIGLTSPKSGFPVTAVFEKGKVSGSTGCRTYTFSLEVDGHQLKTFDISADEKPTCNALMGQEPQFLDLMAEVETYILAKGQLEIKARNGKLIFLPKKGAIQQEMPQTFSGFLILGNEVSDFRDCNNLGNEFWVEDETGTLDSLYKTVAAKEYEPVFLQMEALKQARLPLGYAEERDGLMRIRKVLKMEKRTDKNNCLTEN